MNIKQISLVLVILLGLMSTLPAAAQGGDLSDSEQELLAVIIAAYDNLRALETIQATTTQTMTQAMSYAGQDINQSTEQISQTSVQTDGSGAIDLTYTVLDQSLSMETQGTEVSFDMTMEGIFIDGEFFVKFSNLPADMVGLLPEEWVTLDALSGQGLNFGNLGTLSGWESLSVYDLESGMVIAIKELPSVEEDGQTYRVFELVLETEAMLEASGMAGAIDLSSMGADGDAFMQAMLDGMTYSQTVWIGEDGFPYYVEVNTYMEMENVSIQGLGMDMTQETLATVDYYGFNEPVKIEIPADLPN